MYGRDQEENGSGYMKEDKKRKRQFNEIKYVKMCSRKLFLALVAREHLTYSQARKADEKFKYEVSQDCYVCNISQENQR